VLWTNRGNEEIIVAIWTVWMSLNDVIRRSNIPFTAYQWLQYVLSLLNYGLIPLTHMSRQKNSRGLRRTPTTSFYGFRQKLLILLPLADRICLRIQFLNLYNLPFVCYLKQKMPLFSSCVRHGFCIIHVYSWKLFRMPIAVST